MSVANEVDLQATENVSIDVKSHHVGEFDEAPDSDSA
jgi:hypothetical protein